MGPPVRPSRRLFLSGSAAAAAGFCFPVGDQRAGEIQEERKLPEPSAARLPRWRGFNLLEKFNGRNERFRKADFEWIAELGFNFVRLPLDYRLWTDPADWTRIREEPLREIDEAVKLGETCGIHVDLNFHRAPGYTVAHPPESRSLWTDLDAQRVFGLHWAHFARRYQGIPSRNLSFNLVNEPDKVEPALYRKAVETAAAAIRKEDPRRLLICDGREWGNLPPEELAGLGVAAATRGYAPFKLTHYQASWVPGSGKWETPGYPLRDGKELWDRAHLRERQIGPWKRLEERGVGVMVGEFGSHQKTPHKVVLDWMRDCLDLWREAGWGWALWNFSGSFGVLDSGRADVAYESWRGRKLDRAMLEILQAG
jgi:endoglucanase